MINSSIAGLLLRSYIDLEPSDRAPIFALGIEQYWASFNDILRPIFRLQRTMPAPFRAQLLSEAGLEEGHVADPRDLAPNLRSPRWNTMCAAINRWRHLSSDEQRRLTLLLHALGFYTFISNRIPDVIDTRIAADGDLAELAYLRASARYVLGRPDRIAEYGHADLAEFETIANSARRDKPVAFNAALKVLVHKAKTGASLQELRGHLGRAKAILDVVAADTDEISSLLLESRFYRAAAFIPQRQSDRDEVIRVMDLAERKALQIIPADAAQELLWRENLHPLMESRTKEAIWLGDLDLALARSLRVIELDPYDSKAWLELGQVRLRRQEDALAAEAYVAAATLGPPASAVARHMAGLCFRDLGKPLLAAFFFQGALEIDPKAISPRDEIQRLPEMPVLNALKDWSMSTFEL